MFLYTAQITQLQMVCVQVGTAHYTDFSASKLIQAQIIKDVTLPKKHLLSKTKMLINKERQSEPLFSLIYAQLHCTVHMLSKGASYQLAILKKFRKLFLLPPEVFLIKKKIPESIFSSALAEPSVKKKNASKFLRSLKREGEIF